MVSVQEALQLIHEEVQSVATQILPIESTSGYIAAQQVIAQYDLPRFDNAAMDGYAITMADAGNLIHAQGTLLAGEPCTYHVSMGSGVRIMTGAVLPSGADAVIPLEEVEVEKEGLRMPNRIRKGANIKEQGEDIAKGERLLRPGDVISAYTIALLASQGTTHLACYRKPRVAVFATGLELKLHFERLQPHQIYNTNAPMLVARAQELGCEAIFAGMATDTPESIRAQIASMLDYDLIITSGGISVGDADYTLQAFESLGMQTLFHKVKIKPGKPTTVGRIGRTWVLNLPGNPTAAALNFELFGRTIIHRLRGLNAPFIAPIKATNATTYPLKPGRPTLLLGQYMAGDFHILSTQGPGMVQPLHKANAFLITDGQREIIEKGEMVDIITLQCDLTSAQPIDFFT